MCNQQTDSPVIANRQKSFFHQKYQYHSLEILI
jgi:hypothetical protein